MALETLALLTAPGNASPSFQGAQDLKGRIQGCVASIVALNTVWEVGRAAYLPELEGYARTDFSLSDKVGLPMTVIVKQQGGPANCTSQIKQQIGKPSNWLKQEIDSITMAKYKQQQYNKGTGIQLVTHCME